MWLSFEDRLEGFISGETTGEVLEEESLVAVPLENLAPCFVTAATTPPPSLPFFRSFLEPGMNGNQRKKTSSDLPEREE
jgi:hypothetical protein